MSNETTKHTPTPWNANGTLEIVAGEWGTDVPTVSVACCDLERGLDGYANAAHIVKCVNAHDALVTALRAYREAYDIDPRERREPEMAMWIAIQDNADKTLAAIDADKPGHA